MLNLPKNLQRWLKLWIPGINNGTTWKDSSGNGNDMVQSNSPTVSRRLQSTITKFANASLQCLISNYNVGISGNSARTIASWVRVDSTPAGWTNYQIFGHGAFSSNAMFHLAILASNTANLFLWGYNNDVNFWVPYTVGKLYHMAVTWDGTTLVLYLDWAVRYSASNSSFATTDWVARISDAGQWTFQRANVTTCNSMIYDRVLTSTEINQLRNATFIK